MSKHYESESAYVSPSQLADRWQVSRSSVDRIARRAGFRALFLGEGKNSTVRYSRKEVLAYEESRRIALL